MRDEAVVHARGGGMSMGPGGDRDRAPRIRTRDRDRGGRDRTGARPIKGTYMNKEEVCMDACMCV